MAEFNNSLLEGLEKTVSIALAEDIGPGDVTADLIAADTQAEAQVIVREEAVICGRPWFDDVFYQVDKNIKIIWHIEEGSRQVADTKICTLKGSARHLLTAERPALNFLQTLSGTATTTARYAAELTGTKTQILDTRKTIPGLRRAQKYAVACGGGKNHRIGLYDQILIKENHIMSAGSIKAAVATARQKYPQLKIEVETENLDEFQQALAAGADIIMLDNYHHDDMKKAVALNRGKAKIEVSGNVTLDNLKSIASTGVDFISSGALTKDLHSIDLSMRFKMDD
ncbi:MAG TPA: carboxylating nicotinate-nucleotide diphosphorylase [Thiotrichales bacterium]|nr:carboxylating nicotinate-nucleotide diphosphorylase [Thiotrichales bacterium]